MFMQKDASAQDHTEPEALFAYNQQLFADEPANDVPADDPAPTVDDGADNPVDDSPNADNPDGVEDKEPPAGAPDEYKDFTAPDGLTYDTEASQEFRTVAKELNLTQDQAQRLTDLYGKSILQMQQQQQEQSEQWAEESKKQFKQPDIDLANKTLGRFADTETIALLNSSGLGNHPKMIALFKSIGKQISEPTELPEGGKATQKTAAEVLYPSMK